MAMFGFLPITQRVTASGDTVVLAAPPAGTSWVIFRGTIHNRGTAVSPLVSLRAGTGAPIRWSARLSANGGSATFDLGGFGWQLAAGNPLVVNLGAAGDIDVNITDYSREPM